MAGATFVQARLMQTSLTMEYQVDAWEVEDGLPENSATAMVQTRDGYLWFGTFGGLVRFNGMDFKVYDRFAISGLTNSGILTLDLDRKERLWASTYQGMAMRDKGRWQIFTAKEGWTGRFSRSFADGPDGNPWFTTSEGDILRFDGHRFQKLPAPGEGSQLKNRGFVDRAGHYWCVHPGRLVRWDEARQNWEDMSRVQNIGGSYVTSGPGRNGHNWILFKEQLVKLDKERVAATIPLSQPITNIWSLHEDAGGNVWLAGHFAGLYRVGPNGQVHHYTTADGLAYNFIRFSFEDREGNLWVGSNGGGLMRLRPRIFYNFGPRAGMPERNVRSLSAGPDGKLYMATYGGGVAVLDNAGVRSLPLTNAPDAQLTLSILRDRTERLWVGLYPSGLYCEDAAGGRMIPAQDYAGGTVRALLEDNQGRVWIGTDEGVASCRDHQFTIYPAGQTNAPSRVSTFAPARDGSALWMAGGAEVRVFEQEHFRRIQDASGTPLPVIVSLLPDGPDAAWLGTQDEGLLYYDRGKVTRLGEAHGLRIKSVRGMIEDGRGYVWLATGYGIWRVNLADLRAASQGRRNSLKPDVFDRADGLFGLECSINHYPTVARSPSGALWFATLKGALMAKPNKVSADLLPPPPVYIEEVTYHTQAPKQAAGVPVEQAQRSPETVNITAPVGPLTLPPGSRRLEIRYTALDYISPTETHYHYRLSDIDPRWIEANNQRVAYYHDLPPGDYEFQVRACNHQGIWNTAGATLAFTVLPFYWQTLWFKIVCTAAGFALLAIIAWSLLYAKFSRLEKEAEIARAKSEFMANISHEIRTPLNAILGLAHLLQQSTLSQKQRDHTAKLHASAKLLLGVLNDFLDFSKSEAAKLRLETTDFRVADLFDEVRQMLEVEANKKGLKLLLHLDPDVPPVLRGDPLRLKQILVNLVGNAIKFTEHGTVELGVNLASRAADTATCYFYVKDTGIGISPVQQARLFQAFTQADASITRKYGGTGLGLAISQRLVQLMGGAIGVNSVLAQGSTFHFTLTLPLPPPNAPLTTAEPARAEGQLRFQGQHILLVEDNPINQEVAGAILTAAGLQVTTADSGQKAIDWLHQSPFDLVLMDIQMPGMSGYETANLIRSEPRFAKLPIIAMTAHASPEDREHCLRAGMNGHLAKPIMPEPLFQLLAQWLPAVRQSAAPAPVAAPDTEDLPGLALANGLRRLSGDRPLYLRILFRFDETTPELIGNLEKSWQARDLKNLARHAHNLRGAAANLSAEPLAEAATSLETSLEKNLLENVPLELERIQREFGILGRSIARLRTEPAAAPAPAAAAPGEIAARLQPLLARLEQQIAAHRFEARHTLESFPPQARTLWPAEMEALSKNLNAFDFSAAGSTLIKLRENLKAPKEN